MTTFENRLRTLQARVRQIAQHTEDSRLPPLFLFTDPERTPDPATIATHMPEGSGVIYRHFGATDRHETAQTLRRIASERGLTLLIGEDAALAEAVGADGLHLREVSIGQARDVARRHPKWHLTAACHSVETAQSVTPDMGLSALFASPVFPSQSPSAQGKQSLGIEGLIAIVAASAVPVYGLGGIGIDTIEELGGTSISGVGATDAFILQ